MLSKQLWLSALLLGVSLFPIYSQVGDCPYPVIFVHGWISEDISWEPTSKNTDFNNIWGNYSGTFHAVVNATDTHDRDFWGLIQSRNDDINGPDGVFNDNGEDDDVQWIFPNEDNILSSGCIYAINFNNGIDGSGNLETYSAFNDAPCGSCSDSNESAIFKQGYALKQAIKAVLTANPTKDKVILMGHSMGGLCSREYLQRTDASNNPKNWIDPSSPDGHKVAKLITVGTPHRGSNSFGNLSSLRTRNDNDRDVIFDLRSEAVRDLRYSYAALSGPDVAGAYLFGGPEADIPDYFPWYWSEDVNCDGDENDVIVGINEAGNPQAWSGTTDNSSMPLPTNVRYTYYVSNVLLSGGDGVVDDERQWIYQGGDGTTASGYNDGFSVPVPHDGVNYRLSDRINGSGSRNHLQQVSDINRMMHALDEGDYPKFAWKIMTDHTYAGMASKRPTYTPNDGNRAGETDRDWYVFDLTTPTRGITVKVKPNTSLAGRIDLYENPTDYETGDALISLSFPSGTTSEQVLKAVGCEFPAGTYYVRVTHENVGETDWIDAFTVRVETHNVEIPTTTGTYIATHETTDRNGWTHYWREASSPTSSDLLLLSMQKDATMALSPSQVTVGVGGSTAINLSTANYVTSGDIWYVMDRYWDASPSTQPSTNIPVKFYYTLAEFTALQSAVTTADGMMTTEADMIAYKFSSAANVNPNPALGHTDGTASNFIMMSDNISACDGIRYSEFAVAGFSGGGLGGSFDTPLPVELTAFFARKVDNFIQLNWTTSLEENFEKFIIQKSTNGLSFEEIGEVLARGGIEETDYLFDDKNPNTNNYYRLKMLDLDGATAFSDIINVSYEQPIKVIASPNPFQSLINVNFETPQYAERLSLRLLDVHGRVVYHTQDNLNKGIHTLVIPTTGLSQGVYFLEVRSDEFSSTLRLVK